MTAGSPILNARGDELLYGGDTDPTVTAVKAPKGAMYVFEGNSVSPDPQIYQKNDDGLSTNWSIYTTGAATDLSNLDSPTAINTDLLPDTDCTHDLGSASLRWDEVHTKSLLSGSDDLNITSGLGIVITVANSSTFKFLETGNAPSIGDIWTASAVDGTGYWATPAAAGANTALSNIASVDLSDDLTTSKASDLLLSHTTATHGIQVLTADQSGNGVSGSITLDTGDSGGSNGASGLVDILTGLVEAGNNAASGNIRLRTGDNQGGGNSGNVTLETAAATTADSGNISLIIGTAGGSQGNFRFLQTGNAPSIGDVWTATSTLGDGYWAAAPSGGDSWGDPVDANIVPTGSALTYEIGAATDPFQTVYSQDVSFYDNNPDPIFNISAGIGASTPSGGSPGGVIEVLTDNTSLFGFFSTNNNDADANATASLAIETGNKTAGTGNSGDISFKTGTSAGGSRGDIEFTDFASFVEDSALIADYWGSNIPALVFDGTSTIATTAFAQGILLKGNNADGAVLVFGTEEQSSGSKTSSEIQMTTGNIISTATGNSGPIFLTTGDNKNSGNTGSFDVKTGNATSGNSGAVNIRSGTASGTRGDINITGNVIDMSASVGHLQLPSLSADPSSPADGAMWYNATSDTYKGRANGTTVTFTVT